MLILGGIFLTCLGLAMLIFPESIYEIRESWKSYSASDPSDRYLLMLRIEGSLFLVVGIAGIIVNFIV